MGLHATHHPEPLSPENKFKAQADGGRVRRTQHVLEAKPVGPRGQFMRGAKVARHHPELVLDHRTIAGVVWHVDTDAPIAGAEILWRGRRLATSATDGTRADDLLPSGSYTITVSAPGFQSTSRSVQIGSSLVAISFPLSPESKIPGDINSDGIVTAVNVQLLINAALGMPTHFDADVNGDGVVNAVDLQLVINAALGVELDL